MSRSGKKRQNWKNLGKIICSMVQDEELAAYLEDVRLGRRE